MAPSTTTVVLALVLLVEASVGFVVPPRQDRPIIARPHSSDTAAAVKSLSLPDGLSELLENLQQSFAGGSAATDKAKQRLLRAIEVAKASDGGAEEEEAVRVAFKEVERLAPAPSNLLDTDAALDLDGVWDLTYTVAAFGEPGVAAARTELVEPVSAEGSGVSGAVNASGLNVDTRGKKVTQTFDLAERRVVNTVFNPLPVGDGVYELKVSGPFSRNPASGQRADVKFDLLEVSFGPLNIKVGWLFDIVYSLRPAEESESWLDTTHLSDNMRLARGNKGSIFVLTRGLLD